MDLLDKDGLTESEFLKQYKAGDYERPSVTTDMVIFTVTEDEADSYRKLPEKELRVLLIRRGLTPSWANGRCLAVLSDRMRRLSRQQ